MFGDREELIQLCILDLIVDTPTVVTPDVKP